MNEKLHRLYDRELSEIKQHKVRLWILVASVFAAIGIFAFANNEEQVNATAEVEAPKVVEPNDNVKSVAKDEKTSKFTNIAGLKKAAEGVEIVNPFKVDINNESENKPAPAFTPPNPSAQVKPIESTEPIEKITLSLKGIAINEDTKMAIIQIIHGDFDKNAKKSKDKTNTESLIVNLGDEVNGRRVIDIGKDFVTFDDGKKLHLYEALDDDF